MLACTWSTWSAVSNRTSRAGVRGFHFVFCFMHVPTDAVGGLSREIKERKRKPTPQAQGRTGGHASTTQGFHGKEGVLLAVAHHPIWEYGVPRPPLEHLSEHLIGSIPHGTGPLDRLALPHWCVHWGGHNKHGTGSRCTLQKQCRPPSPSSPWGTSAVMTV